MAGAAPDNFAHAAEVLRALSPDRHAASLVVRPQVRPQVQALLAFSAEVAAVRERVSDPTPGEIRLQWWSDAIEGKEHGAVAANPVADAFLRTLETHALPAGPLLRLIAARRFDLYDDAMPDTGQFEGYAGETVSVLYQYGAMIAAEDLNVPAADAAGHLGVADALAGHIRAFGFNAAQGRIVLPLSVFAAHGVGEGEILAGRDSQAMRASLTQLAELGQEHLDKAQAGLEAVPKTARPVFACAALIRRDLAAFAKPDRDPFAAPKPRNAFTRLARLTAWSVRNG